MANDVDISVEAAALAATVVPTIRNLNKDDVTFQQSFFDYQSNKPTPSQLVAPYMSGAEVVPVVEKATASVRPGSPSRFGGFQATMFHTAKPESMPVVTDTAMPANNASVAGVSDVETHKGFHNK
jgi:hypothetical protein